MRHRATEWFTVDTMRGKSWYHNRSRAMSAARWIALETGEHVAVSSETTGQTWDVPSADPAVGPVLERADPGAAGAAR